MTEYWKGGKAKKAPYETSHSRIPLPIKDTVELLSQVWKRALSAGRDTDSLIAEIQECIRKWVTQEENPVTGKDETGQHLEVDKLKAKIDVLNQSLAAKETELQLFRTMTSAKRDRPDLSKLRVYQPNRKGGLYSVEDLNELLDKHFSSDT